jgi:hypothetical protein
MSIRQRCALHSNIALQAAKSYRLWMNQKALTTQQGTSRFLRLEKLENNIKAAFRRGLEATRSMGQDFNTIKQEELYTERGYQSFSRYIEDHMQLARQTIERLIIVSDTARLIEDAGLRLPENETQLAELARLEPERQKTIWKLILDSFEQDEITAKTVRIAVEQEQRRAAARVQEEEQKPTSSRSGVKTALDDKANGDQKDTDDSDEQSAPKPAASKTIVPGRMTLTQAGEEALDRIRALCGEVTAEGIEKGYVSISERDLIKWADQSDVAVRNLEHYVVDLRWSVRKALEFEDKIIDGESTLNQLIILARAAGGRAIFEHQDYNELYKITIERTKILQ